LKIMLPKEMLSSRVAKGFEELGYKIISEEDGSVTLEGVFSLRITATLLNVGIRKFAELCEKVTVEGGKKIRRGGELSITPLRSRKITVRLSQDEYEALKKAAKERGYTGRKLSSFFRDTLISALIARMEKKGEF